MEGVPAADGSPVLVSLWNTYSQSRAEGLELISKLIY